MNPIASNSTHSLCQVLSRLQQHFLHTGVSLPSGIRRAAWWRYHGLMAFRVRSWWVWITHSSLLAINFNLYNYSMKWFFSSQFTNYKTKARYLTSWSFSFKIHKMLSLLLLLNQGLSTRNLGPDTMLDFMCIILSNPYNCLIKWRTVIVSILHLGNLKSQRC